MPHQTFQSHHLQVHLPFRILTIQHTEVNYSRDLHVLCRNVREISLLLMKQKVHKSLTNQAHKKRVSPLHLQPGDNQAAANIHKMNKLALVASQDKRVYILIAPGTTHQRDKSQSTYNPLLQRQHRQ